jgi:peptide deformylase
MYPNSKLKHKSEPVPNFSEEEAEDRSKLVNDMFAAMREAGGIGLSAVQIGVLKRVIIVEAMEGGIGPIKRMRQPLVMFNPVILEFSSDKEVKREGCLSFPGVFEEVERSLAVRVRYHSIDGWLATQPFNGQQAHVIQHEAEHLDGMLLSDRMTKARRGQVKGELRKLLFRR